MYASNSSGSGARALLSAALMALALAGCSHIDMGNFKAKSAATGAAGGETAQNANPELPRCGEPLGSLAIVEEDTDGWLSAMQGYGVRSTVPVLRLLAQQSNCFVVVERGRGMRNMMGERALAQSGELRRGSKMGKGQMVAADYTVVPTLLFQGESGGLGGLLSAFGGGKLGAVAGSMKTYDAQSMLALVDNRSGVQVVVAEGSSRSYDIGGVLGLFGGGAAGGLGAYSKTPAGKAVVAAMTDAYKNLVEAAKSYRPQKATGRGGKLKVN